MSDDQYKELSKRIAELYTRQMVDFKTLTSYIEISNKVLEKIIEIEKRLVKLSEN